MLRFYPRNLSDTTENFFVGAKKSIVKTHGEKAPYKKIEAASRTIFPVL